MEVVDRSFPDDKTFSCMIRSRPPKQDGFGLCWEGILGMEPIEGHLHASASIFMYSQNRRVAIEGHDSSYFEIEYEGDVDQGGNWVSRGWIEDALGEYANFARYGE
ncbi:hypothetical protein MOQ72_02265 [Saccharopolyspora sp. K220]|uniref:hypothetical protein n=1 Tax=Saccharopolyspora soli TaxID=2926618 RepID=UPI001F5608FF|nr:hypothetical protein [Saccharopolyspora soli]MCI2416235.1 hypothetical protein [Saccharopolyspora soli]